MDLPGDRAAGRPRRDDRADRADARHARTCSPSPWSRAAARPAGIASFTRIDPATGQVEVAGVLYARSLQRTRAATEAIHLLMRYAFDDLGYRRFEWKCDSLNEPSRRAARRLGFTYEGRFRHHMVTKGRNRDTDWFSVTDAEWPARTRGARALAGPGQLRRERRAADARCPSACGYRVGMTDDDATDHGYSPNDIEQAELRRLAGALRRAARPVPHRRLRDRAQAGQEDRQGRREGRPPPRRRPLLPAGRRAAVQPRRRRRHRAATSTWPARSAASPPTLDAEPAPGELSVVEIAPRHPDRTTT